MIGFWTPDKVAELKAMRNAGATKYTLADRFNCTPNAISGALNRYIHGYKSVVHQNRRPGGSDRWADHKMVEPWAEWSARRKAERTKERQMEMA